MKRNQLFCLCPNLTKYIYLIFILIISNGLSAYNVHLGDVIFSDPHNPNQKRSTDLNGVIDDIIITTKRISSGFDLYPNANQPNYLRLKVTLPPIDLNLQVDEIVDYYVFTTKIYYGWDEEHSSEAFTLSYSSDDGNSYTKVTNYLSAETENTQTTMSYTSDGDVTATQPPTGSPLEVHIVSYEIPVSIIGSITHLRYNVEASPGWNPNNGGNIVINEFDTSLSAEIVPEPSTYALVLGLVACVAVAYKKRINR
jgi:hypothetical protein